MVNGAGASAIACTKLYILLGARKENIIMLDSKGVIHIRIGKNLSNIKAPFATDSEVSSLEEALAGADMFLGLSKGNILSGEVLKTMAKRSHSICIGQP